MMKKIGLLAFAFMFVSVGIANAAVTAVPSPSIVDQEFTVTCTDTNFYQAFNVSNYTNAFGGACDSGGAADSHTAPGNYVVIEMASNETDYLAALQAEVARTTIQITPNWSDPNVAGTITGSSFTGFLAGIGDFLVTQLPAILVVLAALIGLGFLLVRVRRWIGSKA